MRKTTGWQSRPVLITSTFRDMHALMTSRQMVPRPMCNARTMMFFCPFAPVRPSPANTVKGVDGGRNVLYAQ